MSASEQKEGVPLGNIPIIINNPHKLEFPQIKVYND